MTKISAIRSTLRESIASRRTDRAANAALESALRTYRSAAERAELEAILGRYPESDTHRVWESLSAPAAAWGRA
ncbi:MAG: hypothetical protein JWR33_926 [Naasia sp.]|jgi:hypothetical protein|uniref:hypothetical protein n=1 Tax=Naasia sp. TaxID=2546198 RepID=UPI00261703DB|nr:hypothetical protein [Naasia sp.]MCU1570185.1 hypothetical protein [Naasia sp.]